MFRTKCLGIIIPVAILVFELSGWKTQGKCNDALGMESRFIKNEDITANSFASISAEPSNARLYYAGAWVPTSDDVKQVWQVQFNRQVNITSIVIQGHPFEEKWITTFRLDYSNDGLTWHNGETFSVNPNNSSSLSSSSLSAAVSLSYLRINPLNWHGGIALRAEIYGCPKEQLQCGLKKITPVHNIVGGTQSSHGAWPWQVALLLNGGQMCGGTLINENWVLTAAHCFHPYYTSMNPDDWTIVLGEFDLTVDDGTEQKIAVKNLYIHEKYSETDAFNWDAALLRLSTPAKFTSYVQPICLLDPSHRFTSGRECFVSGWGKTNFTAPYPQDILRETSVALVSPEDCDIGLYKGYISPLHICAGYKEGEKDACQYDSGGGLVCQEDDHWYLCGMVSWGHECALPNYYGVYSNLYVITPWVQKTLEYLS